MAKIKVVYKVVMPHNGVVRYHYVRVPCCLHLQDEVLVFCHGTTLCSHLEDHDLNVYGYMHGLLL
jgi:hypothetical protein